MDANVAVAVIAGFVTLGGSWLVARQSGRDSGRKASHTERELDRRRIKELEDRDAMWEVRCNTLWAAREADAVIKRRQGDHIDLLEHHIWQELPPPPPPRPTLV